MNSRQERNRVTPHVETLRLHLVVVDHIDNAFPYDARGGFSLQKQDWRVKL